MIRYKSGNRWPDDREVGWRHARFTLYMWRRQEARVFWFILKTGGDGLSVVWSENKCNGFLVWASKPMSTVWFGPQKHHDSFFVWASKPSARRFACLCLETNEQMKTVWGHSTACFVGKQVRLRFPSFASKLVKEQRWVVHMASSWTPRGSEVKDGRFDGVGCSTPFVRCNFPFSH
jgi:hypothetical protein